MIEKNDSDNISIKIEIILQDMFRIQLKHLEHDYRSENLLGKSFRLSARELLYLFFECEKRFEVRIPEDMIINSEFATINGIAQIIEKCTKQQNKKIS